MKYLTLVIAFLFPSTQTPQTMTGEAATLLAYTTMTTRPSLETPDQEASPEVREPRLMSYKDAHAKHPEEPFLVMVTASWCGPCQDIKPTFESLPGNKTYVDYDKDPAARTLVRGRISLPYFIYFGRTTTRRGNNLQQVYGGGE